MSSSSLLIRADASASIGMGHVMRCLSLAQAHAELAVTPATFLTADPLPGLISRAGESGIAVTALSSAPGSDGDVRETSALAQRVGADWIVLDGYRFDPAFQSGLRAGGQRVLVIDDHGHAGRYHADVVLDQNPGADAVAYENRDPHTRLLLGVRFALLRAEFRRWRRSRPPVPARARRVVVTLGGSDPDNVSARVLEGLAAVPGPLEVLLVIGAANPHGAALRAAVALCPHPVDVVVDARDMPERLAWADLAVAAAGSTSWELALVGTPQMAVVLADNQQPVADRLASDGLAVSLGRHGALGADAIAAAVADLAEDRARRSELSRRGQGLVDGRGALRVLAAMDLSGGAQAGDVHQGSLASR